MNVAVENIRVFGNITEMDSGRSLVIHSLFVDLCLFLRGMVRRYSGDRQRMPALRRSWRAVGGLEQCRNC